jgi:hypothetical protein
MFARVIALCIFCAQVPTDSRVVAISTVFQQIDNDTTLRTLVLKNQAFLGDELPAQGASLKGYFRGDTLCKMTTWIGLSDAIVKEHYYFSKGQLVFVYETEEDYRGKTPHFEGRYYFDGYKAFSVVTTGKKKMGPDDPHHYLELYHNANYYAGLLRKKHPHTTIPPPARPAQTT